MRLIDIKNGTVTLTFHGEDCSQMARICEAAACGAGGFSLSDPALQQDSLAALAESLTMFFEATALAIESSCKYPLSQLRAEEVAYRNGSAERAGQG